MVKRLQVTNGQAPNIIRSIAFSADGKYFAAGGDDKEVYIYIVLEHGASLENLNRRKN